MSTSRSSCLRVRRAPRATLPPVTLPPVALSTSLGGMPLGGKFIVVDGADGSGKGTQIQRLCAWIEQSGIACRRPRAPRGTAIGDRLRHVLLGFDLSQMAPRCEALLFMASRAQLVAEVVRPALAAGQAVVCHRFISSTCAYQVAAGFPREDVLQLGQLAVADTWPDLTLVLDEIGRASCR